ncbi:unnamed protein product, partial [Scytosiphon promiscuus]
EKHFACYVDGCPFTTRRLDHLELHTRRHQNDRRFSCGTCPYKAFTTSDMVVHESTHLNNKPFACHLEWCKQSFAQSNQLTMHKKTHIIEGQIRKKKQENRVNKKLKEWGFTVDCETIIDAVAGECLKDAQRYFSRLDFRIVNCINAICILEVDEFQHYNYNLSCEASGMADVRALLVLAGYTLPIHWIRYSPCGKYKIESNETKTPRPTREQVLKDHLAKVCSPDYAPEKQERIHYLFYDLVSKSEGPEIMYDPDF